MTCVVVGQGREFVVIINASYLFPHNKSHNKETMSKLIETCPNQHVINDKKIDSRDVQSDRKLMSELIVIFPK